MRPRLIAALGLALALVGCSPGAAPSPTPGPAPTPTAIPAVPTPLAASPVGQPVALTARPVQASRSPSPSPQAAHARRAAIAAANTAFSARNFAVALRLYRQAANDDTLDDSSRRHPHPTGPDLRSFARFRIVVADAIVGQEDDARAVLEELRRTDSSTPFPRLALTFWDSYGMTADVRAACAVVTRMVSEEPERYLRSLNGWGDGHRELKPDDVCPQAAL